MNEKTLSRRDFLAAGTITVAGLAAAACAPTAPAPAPVAPAATTAPAEAPAATEAPAPTQAPAEAPAGAAKVVWWGESGDATQMDCLQKAFVDDFNAKHTDAQIDYVYQEDLDRVLRTAMQAGAGPDIVSTPGPGFVLEYVIAGLVKDMDPYSTQLGWKDKLLPWAYETGMVQGKLYSLPLTYESMVVIYNKTLFDQKGWKIPTNRAEIEAIAEAAKKDNIIPFPYGNGDWKPATEHLIGMFLDHYAGADNVYKALIGEKKWTDEEFVGAMSLMNDWFQKGYYSGSIDTYHALTWNDWWPIAASGKGAMVMVGTWGWTGAIPFFTDSKQEWDWFPMPSLREGVRPVYALAIGQTLSINEKSKVPDQSATALDWVFNDPKAAMNRSACFDFGEWVAPVHLKAEDFPSSIDPRVQRFLQDFDKVTSAGDYGYTTWTFWPAKTEVYLYQGFDDVLAGTITVEQYLTEVQKQFDAEVLEGKVPPIPKRNV